MNLKKLKNDRKGRRNYNLTKFFWSATTGIGLLGIVWLFPLFYNQTFEQITFDSYGENVNVANGQISISNGAPTGNYVQSSPIYQNTTYPILESVSLVNVDNNIGTMDNGIANNGDPTLSGKSNAVLITSNYLNNAQWQDTNQLSQKFHQKNESPYKTISASESSAASLGAFTIDTQFTDSNLIAALTNTSLPVTYAYVPGTTPTVNAQLNVYEASSTHNTGYEALNGANYYYLSNFWSSGADSTSLGSTYPNFTQNLNELNNSTQVAVKNPMATMEPGSSGNGSEFSWNNTSFNVNGQFYFTITFYGQYEAYNSGTSGATSMQPIPGNVLLASLIGPNNAKLVNIPDLGSTGTNAGVIKNPNYNQYNYNFGTAPNASVPDTTSLWVNSTTEYDPTVATKNGVQGPIIQQTTNIDQYSTKNGGKPTGTNPLTNPAQLQTSYYVPAWNNINSNGISIDYGSAISNTYIPYYPASYVAPMITFSILFFVGGILGIIWSVKYLKPEKYDDGMDEERVDIHKKAVEAKKATGGLNVKNLTKKKGGGK